MLWGYATNKVWEPLAEVIYLHVWLKKEILIFIYTWTILIISIVYLYNSYYNQNRQLLLFISNNVFIFQSKKTDHLIYCTVQWKNEIENESGQAIQTHFVQLKT